MEMRQGEWSAAEMRGQDYLVARKPMILGISPGNPHYYKDENLTNLLSYANNNADIVRMFIPDVISEHNYRAVGSANPERSARVKVNRLRNKLNAILKHLQLDDSKFFLVDWKRDIESSDAYTQILNKIIELYNSFPVFHNDIVNTTQLALEKFVGGRGQDGCKFNTEEGVLYLLKELAFFEALPYVYPEHQQYTFVYHAPWPVLVNYFAGKYDGQCRPCLGFFVYRISDA